jgi:preprotein translocase subunit YajC
VLASSGSVAVVLAASGGSSPIGLLFPVVLVVGFYLLFMRPARMRQRKAAETRGNVEPGVEVVTTAGLIATVVSSDDETVTLEIAPGVQSKFLKQAIARVVTPPEPHSDLGHGDPGHGELGHEELGHEEIRPDPTDETPPAP